MGIDAEIELHIEPGDAGFHLFAARQGERISSVSPYLPVPLKELIRSQHPGASIESLLVSFLQNSTRSFPIVLHTLSGEIPLAWNPGFIARCRTELKFLSNRVFVRKLIEDTKSEGNDLGDFVHLGGHLVASLATKELGRIHDIGGWYAAELLKEEETSEADFKEDVQVEYDPEFNAPNRLRKAPSDEIKLDDLSEGFSLTSMPYEIPASLLAERKMVYPQAMRSNYVRDIVFKVGEEKTEPKEASLDFRVTLARIPGTGEMMVQADVMWNQKPFEMGQALFKYFEYLEFHQSKALKRKKNKEGLRELAFRMLNEAPEDVEGFIQSGVSALDIEEEDASVQAAEYLRRFHKTFIANPSEQILAGSTEWDLVKLDMRRLGVLFGVTQRILGAPLLGWMHLRRFQTTAAQLYTQLKPLHDALKQEGIQLYFNKQSVQSIKLDFRVQTFQKSGMEWFEVDPKVMLEGKEISEEEWKRILADQGVLSGDEHMLILDNNSLKVLQSLRMLMTMPGKKKKEESITKIPRLQILDWIHLRRLGVKLELSPENEALIEKLLAFKKIESRPLPEGLRGVLRDYQNEAYAWLAFLYEHRLGGCLADDMGLGKTVQAIAFLGGLKEKKIKPRPGAENLPSLIVVPTTLVFNWKNELQTFYPGLNVREYSPAFSRYPADGCDIIITSYDMLRRRKHVFKNKKYHVLIFDEAQFLKNIYAKRTSAARELQAQFTLTLTGTPLENHMGEYYSVLDLSMGGLFGDYAAFQRQSQDPFYFERLNARAKPFVLRRTKSTILKELPAKTESRVRLDMTPKQKALYNKVVSKIKRQVRDAFKAQSSGQASITALTALLRLRQICVAPQIVDAKAVETPPKIEFLVSKLRELKEEEHAALVFSQFTSCLDVVEEALKAEGLECLRMDGKTPVSQRRQLVDSFQCGAGAPVFLISLKTGGVGLNLTRASYVFHLDPWWNPAVENQASDRVHRIGQTKSVFVNQLIMNHTVEEKMMELKEKKLALYRQVLDGVVSKPQSALLTREDFEFLLGEDK